LERNINVEFGEDEGHSKWRFAKLISQPCLFANSSSYNNIMPFAQLVIGPPGSGKSTYCDGMFQFLGAIGRPAQVVNLDPANDHTSYKPALDVRSLIGLEEIMADDKLGPNGAVLHALEAVEHEFEWLEDGLKELGG
jgi:GTPase SAR1 family protein